MPYVYFTDEQKLRANNVDLEDFLLRQGERLEKSGHEKRLVSNHSITVSGNSWFDHSPAEKTGGGPISFVQYHYGLTYPEAVTLLLGGEANAGYKAAAPKAQEPAKPFALPPASRDMRRVYVYLLNRRHISREVLTAFVQAGMIYESSEKAKDGRKEYHNAVFVGCDEDGVARHAQKKGLYSDGSSYRLNVAGSDSKCSFHYVGTDDKLFVFEAPIDLLSFITLNPEGWQEHSYVALCGTAEQAMFWMLEQYSHLRVVTPCLDHDEAGIEATGELVDHLKAKGYVPAEPLRSGFKDWNEDVKALLGMPAQPAEEHPQLVVAPAICARIGKMSGNMQTNQLEQKLPVLLEQYRSHLHWGRFEKAEDCMEQAAALAMAAALRECRQMGIAFSAVELAKKIQAGVQPHQNRGSLKNLGKELATQLQTVLTQQNANGIRTAEDKKQLANGWFNLAIACTKVLVKAEAEEMKLEQKNSQTMEMG